MDEKTKALQIEEMRKRFEDLVPLLRRFMKHDTECAIWRDQICDCGLDAALQRVPKSQDVSIA